MKNHNGRALLISLKNNKATLSFLIAKNYKRKCKSHGGWSNGAGVGIISDERGDPRCAGERCLWSFRYIGKTDGRCNIENIIGWWKYLRLETHREFHPRCSAVYEVTLGSLIIEHKTTTSLLYIDLFQWNIILSVSLKGTLWQLLRIICMDKITSSDERKLIVRYTGECAGQDLTNIKFYESFL